MTSATAETKGEWQWPKEWLDALQALHILPADGGAFQALAISPGPITCHKILEALASVGALARTGTVEVTDDMVVRAFVAYQEVRPAVAYSNNGHAAMRRALEAAFPSLERK